MNASFYSSLVNKKKNLQKSFAVLIDPDGVSVQTIDPLIHLSVEAGVDYFFIGGSLVTTQHLDDVINRIKQLCTIPVVLFPGSPSQVSKEADALLLLSLISGRNSDMLIGQHVVSAPMLKASGLEIVPTGYIVIDGGVPTSVSYMSNSSPIPNDKNNIAVCTAMAGEMLGLKVIYMDAGSGAQQSITCEMIKAVATHIQIPLIVGGGIKTPEAAQAACKAGADIIVVGNAIEKNPQLILRIAEAVHKNL